MKDRQWQSMRLHLGDENGSRRFGGSNGRQMFDLVNGGFGCENNGREGQMMAGVGDDDAGAGRDGQELRRKV